MEFDSESDYDYYNRHPDHSEFVKDFWVNSVEKFLEIDYKPVRKENNPLGTNPKRDT